MALIPTINERLAASRDAIKAKYEQIHAAVRRAKELTRGIDRSEDFVPRAKADKKDKVALDTERDLEPAATEARELADNVSSGEGLGVASDVMAFLASARFVESNQPTPLGVERSLREQRELDARADLDNVQTAAAVATRLSRRSIPQLRAESSAAIEAAQWALYDAIHGEAEFRSESGDPEARRLAIELESFIRKNLPLPVVEGTRLVDEIALFARAIQQSMWALRSHRPDGSRMMIDAFREERREGRSGNNWLMQVDALGEVTLRTASGRRLGQNPPSEHPVPVPPPPKPPPPPPSE